MTIADALLVFTVEVTRASESLKTPAPVVHAIVLDEPRIMANHPYQGRININQRTLWVATTWPFKKAQPWLRCIARHEVTHEYMKHAPMSLDERARNEAQVGPFMLATWGEPDPICLGYLK